MKGIILAGGTGSRLYPLTKITNKHLLPVGNYPMIYHAIFRLTMASIRDILIVTGREHMGSVVNLLGSGHDFGVDFTYKVQDKAGGIAEALGLAEDFVGEDSMAVILGDNVFGADITPFVQAFQKRNRGASILVSKVADPQRFGVPELDGDKIVRIEEKPVNPKSSYAVTGIYLYDSQVFGIIRELKPSARGEYEITDVNNAYISIGQLTYGILEGWWTDAGTPESYFRANELARSINYGDKYNYRR
ncbi:sugar phosphate nucleotidyltransferase [Alicyclobacillus ferrooxydans]|uniref:Glucose-1-phosphate thymidylyltransferase n=1 Tax=Alicyclobacillus ferrooxydans TaxID=471514 RepID=A0A0P9CHC0_9BACL|nr:sugar phosphate nucleotidyltransferase [Alicyclobacillus ferrooxydans]KPV42441.1 spore coat protein [Alicyclobacillus ferrooxydans]